MAGNSNSLLGVLVATSISILSGCGDLQPQVAVSGEVTLDGKVLPQGVVRFVPIEDTPGQKFSAVVEDGRFQLAKEFGPAPGRYRIEIESTDMGGLAMDDEDAILRLRSSRTHRIQTLRVPPAYNSRSQLIVEVNHGRNEFRFELKSNERG